MQCTAIVNGKPCGGNVVDGTCEECFADFSSSPLVVPGAAPDPDAYDPNANPTFSDSKNDSGTRSRNGSRLGTGVTTANALGLSSSRKPRGFDKSTTRTSSTIRAGVGGEYRQPPQVRSSDPRKLIKPKYLQAALALRTCVGDEAELGCPTNSRDEGDKKWVPRSHAPFALLHKDEADNYALKGKCPKCRKPFDFTALDAMPLLPGEILGGQAEVLGTVAEGGCGGIYIAKLLDLSEKPDPRDPTRKLVEQFGIIKGQKRSSEFDDAVSAAEKQMLANLRHPSIVSIIRFIEHRGRTYILTEWIDGLTVEQIYEKANAVLDIARAAGKASGKLSQSEIATLGGKHLSAEEALELSQGEITLEILEKVTSVPITQEQVDTPWMTGITPADSVALTIAAAMSMNFLHEQPTPVINPDIKPGNFMVAANGGFKQIDAGGWLVQTDTNSSITSTKGFAAPEVDDYVDRYPQHAAALNIAREAKKTGGKLTLAQLQSLSADAFEKHILLALASSEVTAALLCQLCDVALTEQQVNNPNFKFIACEPSTYSDQFSLGRMAAFLGSRFDYKGAYRYTFPASLPAFVRYPSLGPWLRGATAANPADRFPSLDIWIEQGWSILREMVAIDTGEAKTWTSYRFDNDISGGATQPDARLLPGLKIDQGDPGRSSIETILKSSASPAEMKKLLQQLATDKPKSREAKLRLANVLIDNDELGEAEVLLKAQAEYDPDDWRNAWYMGKLSMAKQDYVKAVELFDAVVTSLPGEPAAKLALGIASELVGDTVRATTAYDLVTLLEPQYTMAAFGQARCLMSESNRAGALKVLARVPINHVAHIPAVLESARVNFSDVAGVPTLDDLQAAEKIIGTISTSGMAVQRLRSDFLVAAAAAIKSGAIKEDKRTKLLGVPLLIKELGKAACKELLAARHECADARELEAFVREAHARRPMTTF